MKGLSNFLRKYGIIELFMVARFINSISIVSAFVASNKAE